ncbi:MAG: hypothetical protein ABJ327_23020 [Litoreibacter sp.]
MLLYVLEVFDLASLLVTTSVIYGIGFLTLFYFTGRISGVGKST